MFDRPDITALVDHKFTIRLNLDELDNSDQ